MWPLTPLTRHAVPGSAFAALIQRAVMHPESFGVAARSFFSTFSPSHTPPSSFAQSIRRLHLPSPSHISSPPSSNTGSLLSSLQARQLFHSSANTSSHNLRPPFPNAPHTPFSGAPFLNPRGTTRFFAAAPRRADGHVDIAAKARARQAQKLWRLVGGGAVVAAFGAFVLNAFQENLVFYITPTQAMATLSEQGVVPDAKRRLRLGGLVLDGSVRHFRHSTEMEFVVTDLATELVVRYRGALPDLFREGHSVVVEGFLRSGEPESPGEAVTGQLKAADPSILKQTGLGMEGQTAGGERVGGCHFAATEVLAKHDEKYMPKEVAAVVAANKAAIATEKGLTPALAQMEERPKKPSKQKLGQQPLQVQQYELKS
ncbi:hypothetical protein KFL_002780090 [Klebsormidium nitens]|uniref:Cytochrome c-type biogenesis protein CcmE n=1 Tax=Klebsormidium nitens TaxID=105231 RepID=A0A1Y1I5L7_KLENI|nr:hypothetical protein KFL_002780090 [Klebsormidium nitens]|eukprot:GAQ86245.1 hypothetical protein KFL_002780090 [Klebsormidium nitens]